jgi:hypothetical protein
MVSYGASIANDFLKQFGASDDFATYVTNLAIGLAGQLLDLNY